MKSILFIFTLFFYLNSFAEVRVLTLEDLIGENPNGNKTPIVTRTDMDSMTPADRNEVSSTLRNTPFNPYVSRHCTTQRDGSVKLDQKCEAIDVRAGDQNFRPELIDKKLATSKFANVPKNAKVEVRTQCEGAQFKTRVYINGKPFVNPYNGQSAWKTSPGQYNRIEPPYKLDSEGKFVKDANGRKVQMSKDVYESSDCNVNPKYCTDFRRKTYRESYRTRLPVSRNSSQSFGGTGDINQWHVVSDAKAYSGAQMPFTVWLNNSGHAYHASTSTDQNGKTLRVDGWPASAGCFRLDEANAKGMFNLVRRVGTRNMKFFWGGYKNEKGQVCDRPKGARAPISDDITPARSKASKTNIFKRFWNWLGSGGKSRANRGSSPNSDQ